MAIFKELWIPVLLEGFYPDNSFLARARNLDTFVEYNKLHLSEAGADPNVLIDNTVYPVPIAERTDNPLEIILQTFDTENTVVRSIDELQTAYEKMESIVRQHRNALQKKAGQLAAFNFSPAGDGAFTPVLKTTGAINTFAHKALTFEDVEALSVKYNMLEVPRAGRILVLNPEHEADLHAQDRKLYREVMATNRLFGFEVFTYSQTPNFDVTTGVKQPFLSLPTADSVPSSFSYFADEVGRAMGDIDMFSQYDSPTERGDIVGFQMRFAAVPLRNKYMGAIYSDR